MEADETNPLVLGQETATETANETEIEEKGNAPESALENETEGEAGEPNQTEEEIEYADVEWDGKQYRIPATLKNGIMMQSDYTRKTQEVAEQRKANEAKLAEIEALRNVSDEEINTRAELVSINRQLEQYANVDWNAYDPNDPLAEVEMGRHWRNFQSLQQKAQQMGQTLHQSQAKRAEMMQQDTAKRLQETREFAEKNIKGWTPETDAKVTEFATKELGFTVDTLKQAYNPGVYQTLYLAWIGNQALKSAAQKKPAVQEVRPLQTVSSKGGTARKDLTQMSMDEYAEYRNQQERRKATR